MEDIRLPQPRSVEHAVEARCARCQRLLYLETITETRTDGGEFVRERAVRGCFRQALDGDGNAAGPVIPCCYRDALCPP